MDETTSDRRTLNEITLKITPISAPNLETDAIQPTPSTLGSSDHSIRHLSSRLDFHDVIQDTFQGEIRDDILVEDLTPHPTDPIETSQPSDRNLEQAIALLKHYSFEIEGSSARGFATYWADDLPSEWLRLAVLEALYQGRYKAVSVSQILALWERKQQPQIHFNEEFERLICDRLFAEVETKNQENTRTIESDTPPLIFPSSAETAPPGTEPDQSSGKIAGELNSERNSETNLASNPEINPDLHSNGNAIHHHPLIHPHSVPLGGISNDLSGVCSGGSGAGGVPDAMLGLTTPGLTTPGLTTDATMPLATSSAAPNTHPDISSETIPQSPELNSEPSLQRSHPTPIAQFVPEGESHIYDKLRDLALTANLEEFDREETHNS